MTGTGEEGPGGGIDRKPVGQQTANLLPSDLGAASGKGNSARKGAKVRRRRLAVHAGMASASNQVPSKR